MEVADTISLSRFNEVDDMPSIEKRFTCTSESVILHWAAKKSKSIGLNWDLNPGPLTIVMSYPKQELTIY
jgi:hypothetical protein